MDHTFYLQITPCLPFLRKHSPDGATPEVVDIHLLLTTHKPSHRSAAGLLVPARPSVRPRTTLAWHGDYGLPAAARALYFVRPRKPRAWQIHNPIIICRFIDPERMKSWVDVVGWPIVDGLPVKWSPVSYRSSAGQGKFAGLRPTLYHRAMQPGHPTICKDSHSMELAWTRLTLEK